MAVPRYAIVILTACVLGACGDDDSPSTRTKCVCQPTVQVSMEPGGKGCSNATFDWLLQTMMTKMSEQTDELEIQTALAREREEELLELQEAMEKVKEELSRADELYQAELEEANRMRQERDRAQDEITARVQEIADLAIKVEDLQIKRGKERSMPRDCADVLAFGYHYSGIYTIYPHGSEGLDAFCDLNTEQGGWTVIQRRQDGSETFERNWDEYKSGFGKVAKEFWLGNELLHKMTQSRNYALRVDLTDFEGQTVFAEYEQFTVDSEDEEYTLHVGKYKGNAGNSLSHHDGQPFSTTDNDNDKSRSGNCAELFGGGGWWFVRCYDANLNGRYTDNEQKKDGIVWFDWGKNHKPIKHAEMKIRPK